MTAATGDQVGPCEATPSESTTGQDGLRVAFDERPDLVVLNLLMPDLQGAVRAVVVTGPPGGGKTRAASEFADHLLAEQIGSMERVARQYAILRNSDSLSLLQQDVATINQTLDGMMPLAEEADAVPLARSIRVDVQHVLSTLRQEPLPAEVATEM